MRTAIDAVKWARSMDGKPAPGGPGHCLELVRDCYGTGPWATSAKLAFEKTPKDQRHTTPDWKNIPAGAIVYFPSLSIYGHVILSLGGGKALSNDYLIRGKCGIVPIDIPKWHGQQHFGAWTFWTPFGVAK